MSKIKPIFNSWFQDSLHCRPLLVGVVLLLTLFLLKTVIPAKADIGPKPSMDFSIDWDIVEIELLDGKLLLCKDQACLEYIEFTGPINCTPQGCYSYALWGEAQEFVQYHKLVLTFEDRVRESNIFTKQAHNAKYKVLVEPDKLVVSENRLAAFFNPFLLLCFSGALLVNLSIEVLAAFVYLRMVKKKLRMLVWVAIANLLSLSVIWLWLGQMIESVEVVFIIIAETFAVVFEAIFLYLFGRKLDFTWQQALILSLIINAASFTLGYLGWFLLSRP